MPLHGTLDPTFISSLFQIFCDEKKSGIFSAHYADTRITLHIRNGAIVYASGADSAYLIVRVLQNRKVLTADQLSKVEVTVESSDRTIEQRLLDLNLLQEAQLSDLLQDITHMVFMDLLQQSEGQFEFHDTAPDALGPALCRVDIRRALLETFRKLDELESFRTMLPDPSVCFKIPEKERRDTAFQIDAASWRILSLAHTGHSLDTIIRKSGYDAHRVYATLVSLIEGEMIVPELRPQASPRNKNAPDPPRRAQTPPPKKGKKKGLLGIFKKQS